MAAALNLPIIEKGATYRHKLVWNDTLGAPIDLTGATAKMQVRSSVTSPDILLELNTENTRIIITPLTGTIELIVSAADTSALLGRGGSYDLEIIQAGATTRLIEGKIVFKDEVTR